MPPTRNSADNPQSIDHAPLRSAAPAPELWTSRRRLLAAFRGEMPDRVPINTYELAGRNSRDWYNLQPSYRRLMDDIRARTDCITNWTPSADARYVAGEGTFLQSAYDLPIDKTVERRGDRTRTTRVAHTPSGDLQSVTEEQDGLFTTWVVEHWCKSTEDVDKALAVPYAPPTSDVSDLPRVRAELGEDGLVMASLGDPAYVAADLMSFQDFTLWAFQDTEHYARTVEIVAERVLENLRRQLDAAVVDFYRLVGPEYLTPPFLPPHLFARFAVPHVRAMTDLIHQRGALVRLHCHGRIAQVLDMILDTGCDGIDPCEPPPDGDLELDQVKARCAIRGARGVSVWGNIELKLLENGTPGQVRDYVHKVMEQAKDGGGLVLMPTAAPIDTPLSPRTEENYRALIDAGLEFGGY